MSFDTEFNYSKVFAGFTTSNTKDQSQINVLSSEIDLLSGASAYANLTANRLSHLKSEVERLTTGVTKRNELVAELHALKSLSQEEKTKLYAFFNATGDKASQFMLRLPFNSAKMLSDVDLGRFLSDTTSSLAQKAALITLIYNKYNMERDYTAQLMEASRLLMR
jgi:hypothetical protein